MAQHGTPSHTGGFHLSSTNKIFAGVCGGLAEYFDMNATLLRVFWVAVTLVTGIIPGVAVYLLTMYVMKRGFEE